MLCNKMRIVFLSSDVKRGEANCGLLFKANSHEGCVCTVRIFTAFQGSLKA